MIAVLLVVVGAKQILINTLGTAFFFRPHLTIVPCVLMIPILVGITYVIPKYQFEKMSRESVVERIRSSMYMVKIVISDWKHILEKKSSFFSIKFT